MFLLAGDKFMSEMNLMQPDRLKQRKNTKILINSRLQKYLSESTEQGLFLRWYNLWVYGGY